MLTGEAAPGGEVISEAKRIWSHLILPCHRDFAPSLGAGAGPVRTLNRRRDFAGLPISPGTFEDGAACPAASGESPYAHPGQLVGFSATCEEVPGSVICRRVQCSLMSRLD